MNEIVETVQAELNCGSLREDFCNVVVGVLLYDNASEGEQVNGRGWTTCPTHYRPEPAFPHASWRLLARYPA